MGDGGFLFACGDLATAAQERLPLTTVLVDDGGYGMLAYDFTKDGESRSAATSSRRTSSRWPRPSGSRPARSTVDGLAEAVRDGIASGAPNLVVVKAGFTPPPNTSPRWYRTSA